MYATALETQPSTAHGETCARCGTFAALSPFWGRRLCTACVERESSALGRGQTGVGGLLSGVFAMPSHAWAVSVGLHVLAGLPSALRTMAGDSSLRGIGADMVLGTLASVLTSYVAVEALHGRKVGMKEAFRGLRRRAGAWFAANFVASVWVFLFALLLIVPGIYKAASLALVTPIALFESHKLTKQVLAASTERMKGARLAAFGAYAPFFLTPMLLGGLAGYFFGESTEFADRAVVSIVDLAGGALLAPAALVTALLYVRRTPPDAVPAVGG